MAQPAPLQSDILSKVLTSVRLRGELIYTGGLSGPWAARVAPGAAHLLVVQHGEVWLTADEAPPLKLAAGDLAVIPHGRGHSMAAAEIAASSAVDLFSSPSFDPSRSEVHLPGEGEPTRVVGGVFHFETQALPPLVQALPSVIHIPSHGATPDWLELLVHFLVLETREREPGAALMISRTIDLLVIRALRAWIACQPAEALGFTTCADTRIARALDAMHIEPAEDWTLERLARLAGMSRSAFAPRFALLMGEAPMRHLLRWRMTIAEQMLRTGQVAVGEVGRRVDYESEAGFSRAFKASFGRSPKTSRPSAPRG